MESEFIKVVITDKKTVATDYGILELTPVDGGALPPFTAGAHIGVKTPEGSMRQYSLAGSPYERGSYRIAVRADRDGRGASRSMVEETSVGGVLEILPPENNFELVPADEYLFIAGGIGITPILSMCHKLWVDGQKNFRLIYCTRSREETVFAKELEAAPFASNVTLHHDGGDPERIYDLWPHLETPGAAHVYCCGPKVMMEDVRDMSGHWSAAQIHFEDFRPVEVRRADDREFTVVLKKSNRRLRIPEDQTILETLRKAGYDHRSSCESGVCGACKTVLLDGEADHRDLVLSEGERGRFIMICVSRAAGQEITIDI